MPKIDIAAVAARKGSGYPPPFDAPCASRTRKRLGDAGGLQDFGVNLMTLPAGSWCPDIDMMSSNADGRFVHRDGTPYPKA
jgi:uncharacterized cupin superfamily protein